MNEAALTAARENLKEVTAQCFEVARDRIVLGEKRDARLSQEEREVVAYHESGHAIMAYYMPKADPLTRVTIIPHGMALGVTEQTPKEDRYNYSESYLRDRIKVMLGGRSAEKIIYREVTTGAQNDLKGSHKTDPPDDRPMGHERKDRPHGSEYWRGARIPGPRDGLAT